MACKLVVSEDAHRDIDDVVGYIINELKNPQAVSHFLDDVEQAYQQLVENPHLFALCSNNRLQKQGYRKVVIKNYLVLYREDEEAKIVYVVRIVYSRRDYAKLL